MKKFKVKASYVTYVYAYIEANDKNEAYQIAYEMDGGDFERESDYNQGDWEIDNVMEITE
jgi:hypothetical protein